MKPIILLCLLAILPLCHAEPVLRVDYRDRPPEMQMQAGKPAGPLITVLETAAQRVGVTLEWRHAPFVRSLNDLQNGRVDVVPRVVYTAERKSYVHFLPAIGTQRKSVRFVVRPGQERSIRRYGDLYGKVVGAKRGTVYFDRFDADTQLTKSLGTDDHVLAKMFRAGRLDTLAVLDTEALTDQFRRLGFSDYRYANYYHEQDIGNYFGASLALYQGERKALYDRLGEELRHMRDSGEIVQIYNSHGVPAPSTEE
ncbi:MAG: substrate-binding periplasmic protein [Pseudomonas sp.]|uniref:substrate-binding periplasmic protein n=1 Tax=Pseudomonas sp. TaxID=306 RepID=UPI003D0EE95C